MLLAINRHEIFYKKILHNKKIYTTFALQFFNVHLYNGKMFKYKS